MADLTEHLIEQMIQNSFNLNHHVFLDEESGRTLKIPVDVFWPNLNPPGIHPSLDSPY